MGSCSMDSVAWGYLPATTNTLVERKFDRVVFTNMFVCMGTFVPKRVRIISPSVTPYERCFTLPYQLLVK